jgi:hypothetical protein
MTKMAIQRKALAPQASTYPPDDIYQVKTKSSGGITAVTAM